MNKRRRKFKLDDGTILTVDDMMEKTGWARNTCYYRLNNTSDPKELFAERTYKKLGGLYVYTLDDGSEWTSETLAQHLQCKRSTASTRLSMMQGDSKRILSPVRGSGTYEESESLALKKRLRNSMWSDPLGHWALLNRAL